VSACGLHSLRRYFLSPYPRRPHRDTEWPCCGHVYARHHATELEYRPAAGGNKVANAAQQCRGECGTSSIDQINFMSKHKSGSISGAQLHCTCQKVGGAVCLDWLKSCGGLAMDAHYPKPTQIP
jgi:hypothetical protein